jgi:phosphonoacetaldehyde hydrolase
MGLHKRDHIRRILGNTEVAQLWMHANGAAPTEADCEHLFARMTEVQLRILKTHSRVLPGVPETVKALRARGIKVGSTTGYARGMMAPLITAAAAQGYSPDCVICPEDVGEGRPFPWMIYRACKEMRVYPLSNCIKVGDTVSDIEEGRNAGTWTVGVTRTGNLVGLSEEEWLEQSDARRKELLDHAGLKLREAGADFVIESVADLPAVIDSISQPSAVH